MANLDDLLERVEKLVSLEDEVTAARSLAGSAHDELVRHLSHALVPAETVQQIADAMRDQGLMRCVLDDITLRVTQEMHRRRGDVFPGDAGFARGGVLA